VFVRLRGDQRVSSLGAPDRFLPDFGIGVMIPPGVLLAQPRIEAVIPGPRRHVADPRHQGLIKADTRRLKTEWIQAALLEHPRPFRYDDQVVHLAA
jgi:hypothetical protein